MLLPSCGRPSFTPTQTGRILVLCSLISIFLDAKLENKILFYRLICELEKQHISLHSPQKMNRSAKGRMNKIHINRSTDGQYVFPAKVECASINSPRWKILALSLRGSYGINHDDYCLLQWYCVVEDTGTHDSDEHATSNMQRAHVESVCNAEQIALFQSL